MKLKDYIHLSSFSDSEDSIAQMAYIICARYGFTYDQVDNNPKLFLKYSKKVTREFANVERKPFFQLQSFHTDARQINFGQFIEVQYFLSNGLADNIHFIAASILCRKTDHQEDAARLLNKNVRTVLPDVKVFLESFAELIKEYSELFEQDEPEDDEPLRPAEDIHPFIKQYGWLYSARQVAKDQGMTVEQSFDMPIILALNTLAYLKSEQAYIKKMSK